MKARFKTKCSECEDDIKAGQEIVRFKDKWVHKKCGPEEEI